MTAIPTATYRLQFNRDFTFADATEIVPYLAALGVDHIYASPIFRAAPGSTHGYDVYDHNELNPELGTRADFDAFSQQLKKHGLGLILDFVPNHMGIEKALNPWWRDVLENGPASPYARYFDIDWQPLKQELKGRVLLPILADQYGRVLESDGFRLIFEGGSFLLQYGDVTLPMGPRTTLPLLRRAIELLTPAPPELESIITAIQYLPGRTETSEPKVIERARESRIIRERLKRLCAADNAVAGAIQRATSEFQDPSDPKRLDRMDELVDGQPYRLSSWRVAAEEINYRRFFDVNSLAAIRMEHPEVFDATHRLLLELIHAGHVTGVRIDHIDGLADPHGYLVRLREKAPDIYLLVEKILGPDEKLRPDWPVAGTTGYEFANEVTQVLIAAEGAKPLSAAYHKLLGFHLDYREVVYRSKRLVMQSALASEVNALGQLLNRISESNRWYRDFTVNALTAAVREVIACFPVYRTYLESGRPVDEHDTRVIQKALAMARRRNPALERTVFEFLRDVLLPPAENAHPVNEELRRAFVSKFQQCTSPIAAKGVEDTAFYVYNCHVASNEVGGEPDRDGIPVEAFHRQNATRLATFPHTMLATSTHDTKRSEDVRARIAAISELPDEWSRHVRRWHTMNQGHHRQIDGEPAPDANEEYLLYQTLIGAWPLEGLTDENRCEFIQRIQAYMMKALHEAKVNSSWLEPNETWDQAVSEFVSAILAAGTRNRFPASIEPFAQEIAKLGAMNSLAQVILKLTCPGVPDFYQGTELWDFSLVDPDNRRPVDYDLRRERLGKLTTASPQDLLDHWQDGRIKAFIIQRLLQLRREHADVFSKGSYEPISASGKYSDCLIAFERAVEGKRLLVVVPRTTATLGFPPVGKVWEDTTLAIPAQSRGSLRDAFTGREYAEPNGSVASLFDTLPVAVLLHTT